MNGTPDFLKALAQVLIQPTFIWTWVAIISSIFLVGLSLFLWRQSVIRSGIKAGTKTLGIPTGKEGLNADFDNLSNRLDTNPVVGRPWKEFRKCLIFPQEQSQPIRSSRDAADYFNTSSIIDRNLSIRTFNSLPNILTGLGILGTFMGLAAGIAVAQEGLGQDDIDLMQGALGNLLGGASLAFITSVVGLGLSLIFLTIERLVLGNLNGKLREFVQELESLVVRVTPERILTEQLAQLSDQSNQLKRFNTELAFQIADALDEKVAGRLTPALDRLIESVNELRDQQAAAGQETIQALVEEFRRAMSGSTMAEFDQIASTLQRVDEALSRTAEEFKRRETSVHESMTGLLEKISENLSQNSERIQSDMESSLNEIMKAVQASMTELQEGLKRGREEADQAIRNASERASAEMQRTLTGTAETMTVAAAELAARIESAGNSLSSNIMNSATGLDVQLRELRSHAEAVTQLSSSVQEAASDLTEATRGNESLIQRLGELDVVLRATAEGIKRGSQSTEDGVRLIQDALTQTGTALQSLRESQEETAAAWSDYRSRFEGLDQSLKQTFSELNDGVSRYTTQVSSFHRGMDENLGRAVESLGGAIKDLEDVLEEMADSRRSR